MQHLAQTISVSREQLSQGIPIALAEPSTETIRGGMCVRHGLWFGQLAGRGADCLRFP